MKKKLLLLVTLTLISSLLFAAPFGLRMGMNLEEISQACGGQRPKNVKDDCYKISPEKNHPLFEEYYAYVDDVEGLYYIKAVSSRITSNRYGAELKEKFYEISNRIAKTYGTPEIADEILDSSDYFASQDNGWLAAITNGSRILAVIWQTESPMKDNLEYVYLYVTAEDFRDRGWVNLEYRFTNAYAVEDSQDDVF
ncbi:MAG: hypothetical protein IKR40_12895 [Treponema sp.]|nr:hypothetical protein [Treponema sp.]